MIRTKYRTVIGESPTERAKELVARLDKVEPRQFHEEPPVVWGGGDGAVVWDEEVNQYIDFTSGIFVSSVGHDNYAVFHRTYQQHLLHAYGYPTPIRAEYLERLTKWCGYEQAILLSSGSEAVDCAIKLMRLRGWPERNRIVSFSGAFHGRTAGAQSVSGTQSDRRWCDPRFGVYEAEFPYPWDARISGWLNKWNDAFIPETICGVILEAFQGWCCAFYPDGFIRDLVAWCKEYDIPICMDEMQSGFGRTGKRFMYEHYGFKPDLICVGKAMGGGYPLSGVLGSREMLNPDNPGDMSSTHSGNPAACAAGLAVLDEIDQKNLVEEAHRKGSILIPALCALRSPHIVRVNGKGLIAAIMTDTEEFATKVVHACMRKGLLVVHTGKNSIKIGPPLVIDDEAILEGVMVIGQAMKECE